MSDLTGGIAEADDPPRRGMKRLKSSASTAPATSAQIQLLNIPSAPKNKAVPSREIQTPDYPQSLFKLHTLAAFFGPRGSGKTNGCVLLAKEYIDAGSFTRTYVISPTYDSNPVFEEIPTKREDVYTDISTVLQSIADIVNKIEEDVVMYENEVEYAALYKRVSKLKEGEAMGVADEIKLERNNYRKPLALPRPYPLVIIDDCSHSQIYSLSKGNPFINLCLRHRHIGGEGYGCSIFMLVQNFKTGVPKPIRQNLQQFFIWRTADRNQLESMWEEFANLVDFDTFSQIYHHATDSDRHNFLTVDMNPIDERAHFRRNFDTVLYVKNREELINNI